MSELADALHRYPVADAPLARRPPVAPELAGALADLAAAGSRAEVAAAAVAHAAALTGARASALGLVTAARTELRLAGSTGYGCDSMAAGALLPLDAGLPITEAARTGRPVVGGGWVAVPLAADPDRPDGALLVSLHPTGGTAEVALLTELTEHTRRALHRVPVGAAPAVAPTVAPAGQAGAVTRALRLAGVELACRSEPLDAASDGGGDVVETVADGSGGLWVVVADACGSDAAAARAARDVRLLARALGRHVDDPADLLDQLDEGLDRAGDSERYVTVFAARITPLGADEGVRVAFASAGHPMPVVVPGDRTGASLNGARAAGLPLNLRLGQPVGAPVHELVLPPGATLFAYTDGLTDRRDRCLPDEIVADVCLRATLLGDAATALDTVFSVLDAAQGPVGDDTAAVLLRVR